MKKVQFKHFSSKLCFNSNTQTTSFNTIDFNKNPKITIEFFQTIFQLTLLLCFQSISQFHAAN